MLKSIHNPLIFLRKMAAYHTNFVINVRLWIGVGPNSFSAAICAAVPYPLCFANPFSGYSLSYSSIMWSLVTFARMLAAAMETLFASPLMIGTCGIATCGIVTASFKRIWGAGSSFAIAWRIAS